MLSELESQLGNSFATLADNRARNGWPVFAIEHGLTADEIELLKSELQAALTHNQQMSREHFLVWVVIAAEIGYSYSGDEFWQSFVQQIPAWGNWGDRPSLKRRFLRFAKEYHGFRPQGRWAEHFSIISWPISHAILAGALHSKFAQLLHDTRFELSARQNWANAELGRFTSDSYFGNSTLLAGLLEQHELTGSLVSNLGSEIQAHGDTPIQPGVLQRLCDDIESARLGRTNLQGFRHVQRTTNMRVRGGLESIKAVAPPIDGAEKTSFHQRYRPKLIAKVDKDGAWQLGLNLQGIAGLLAEHGIRLREMRNVRMKFVGQRSWSPIQALRTVVAKPMIGVPDLNAVVSKPLIEFDGEADGLDLLKQIVIGPPMQTCWLLRMQASGLAHEVAGRHIKRNSRYLLLTHQELSKQICKSLNATRASCITEGPVAYILETNDVIAEAQKSELKKMALGWRHRIDVSPIGLVPRWEDGADSVVFVQGEAIFLRIDSDAIVDGFTVRVDSGDAVRVNIGGQNSTILELSDLDIGSHRICIAPIGLRHSKVPETEFYISIRSREHWSLLGAPAAGFSVETSPHTVSFDDVKDRKSAIQVLGLQGETCQVSVSLFDHRLELIHAEKLGSIKLPSRLEFENSLFKSVREGPLAEYLQDAGTVTLSFEVPHIARIDHSFDQELAPIRWKVRHRDEAMLVRLVDETDSSDPPKIFRASLASPDKFRPVEYAQVCVGDEIEVPGAMYQLKNGEHIHSRAFTMMDKATLSSFSQLGSQPVVFESNKSSEVIQFLTAYKVWRSAKFSGPLAPHRRRSLLREMEIQLFRLILPPRWVDTMWTYSARNPDKLPNQQRHVGGSPGFASQIRAKWKIWSRFNQTAVDQFADHAIRYGITEDARLAKCAFVLAVRPHKLNSRSEPITNLLDRAGESPSLWKGAFFAKTVIASHKQAERKKAQS